MSNLELIKDIGAGDRIKVVRRHDTEHESGTVTSAIYEAQGVVASSEYKALRDASGNTLYNGLWEKDYVVTVTVLEKAEAVEPPVGSVVILEGKVEGAEYSTVLHRGRDGWTIVKSLAFPYMEGTHTSWLYTNSSIKSFGLTMKVVSP